MAVSRPIIEFGGMEVFFLLVDSRPFWEAAFLGTAFLARNHWVEPLVFYAFEHSSGMSIVAINKHAKR